jgi:hypothetical protein
MFHRVLTRLPHAHQFLEALGRFGFLEHGQHVAELAQFGHIVHAHAKRHAAGGAKQVAQHRDAVAGRVFKQQGRATGTQCAVAQGGHFQVR